MHPITNDFVDTLRLSRRLLPELKHHRLSDLANYYNIDTTGSHRSLFLYLHHPGNGHLNRQ